MNGVSCASWSGLVLLLLASTAHADALGLPASEGVVRAADHALDSRMGRVRVVSTWALSEPLPAGSVVPLAQPLRLHGRLESTSFELAQCSAAVGCGLRARRPLPAGLHRMRFVARRVDGEITLPMPRSRAISRVRVPRSLRFTPDPGSSLQQHTGIMVARDIGRQERRRADRALDGPSAHRRLGAIYVRGISRTGEPEGLAGTIESTEGHDARALALLGLVFVVLLSGLAFAYRHFSRAVDNERVDLFLERELDDELRGADELWRPSTQGRRLP